MPLHTSTDSNRALNEILVVLYRSLPVYLGDAAPWVTYGSEDGLRALERIVAEKNEQVRRMTALLEQRRHIIARGEFPMDYTSLHDVSLGYLIKTLIHEQRRDVKVIENCTRQLNGDPEAQALANEVLSSAQAHLRSFESLGRESAAAA
jgi:hypothetical protein